MLMNKRYFAITTLIFGLLCSAACSTIVGAYSDDPYGPVVDCDSELPMDELIQCVKKRYANMDSVYENLRVKTDKKYRSWDKNNYNEFSFSYKKTPKFISIKPCYNKDSCQTYSRGDGRGLTNYDKYDERKIRVESVGRNIMGESYQDTRNNKKIDKTLRKSGWVGAFASTPNYFIRSYKNPNKDIIIFNQNDKAFLYVPLIELIKLPNNKALVVANINRFCLRKQPNWWVGKIKNNHFASCGVYRFFYTTDAAVRNVPVAISLDQRENPNKIYLKIAEDIFEIKINQKEENNQQHYQDM